MKRQGYNDRLDESLEMRKRKKDKKHSQSMASRRRESEEMEKAEGKRKYAAVKTMKRNKRGQ